jgi:hypothetical protein
MEKITGICRNIGGKYNNDNTSSTLQRPRKIISDFSHDFRPIILVKTTPQLYVFGLQE